MAEESQMMSRPTIADVAARCGLSISTVSRAFNGKHREFRIPQETRQRVLDVAAEMGYRASWTARTLTGKKSKQIGLLFGFQIPEFRGVSEEMLRKFSYELEAFGYHLLFVPLHGRSWTDVLADQRLDACAVTEPLRADVRSIVQNLRMPVILLNNVSCGRQLEVIPDDVGGARQATEHLVALGHRRIAMLRCTHDEFDGGASHHSIASRRQGYTQVMHEHGLDQHLFWAERSFDQVVPELVAARYTAVITYSDRDAVVLLRKLHQQGLRVPQDMSIVSFNNVYPLADLVPAITTIDIPSAEIGRLAAQMLIRQLNGETLDERRAVLPERLILRESTCPPDQLSTRQ